jgi:uncharacterized membrane protein YagU involved in acid resistance
VIARLARATILTAICDGLFSSALNVFAYGSTVKRLWQGVASVPFGATALQQDSMAWAGVAMHVGVAFAWSAVFLILYEALPPLRRLVAAPLGLIAVAAVYGPMVWTVMSFHVIPAMTHRPPAVNERWWVQFAGHAIFVGLPIVAMISGRKRPR